MHIIIQILLLTSTTHTNFTDCSREHQRADWARHKYVCKFSVKAKRLQRLSDDTPDLLSNQENFNEMQDIKIELHKMSHKVLKGSGWGAWACCLDLVVLQASIAPIVTRLSVATLEMIAKDKAAKKNKEKAAK